MRLNRGLVNHKRGRPSLLFEKSKNELEKDLTYAKENLSILKSQQSVIKEAKKGIAESYHPYNLNSGSERSAKQVQDELLQHFNVIEENAKAAQLNQSAIDKINKAKRVCSGLVATISFFWMLVCQFIESLSLSKEMERLMRDILIPAHYLMIASKKYKKAEERKRIYQQAMQLLVALKNNAAWKLLDKAEQDKLTNSARDCAQLFQRSSSCLEGRNGYLSLRHHGLHHLSTRKLGALTVIHNYFITRSDNTTAAERFFGKKHESLFEYVMKKMPSLSRPSIQKAILRRAV
jgi:hypothetical protein